MLDDVLEPVFGSRSAARVLLFLQNYGEGYATEIVKTFPGMSLSQAQRQLEKFEQGGVLVSRNIGRTRLYQWNPRSPVSKPLREMLESVLAVAPQEEQDRYFMQRRRPRRAGKALEFRS